MVKVTLNTSGVFVILNKKEKIERRLETHKLNK
jgi:hypothetical protein